MQVQKPTSATAAGGRFIPTSLAARFVREPAGSRRRDVQGIPNPVTLNPRRDPAR